MKSDRGHLGYLCTKQRDRATCAHSQESSPACFTWKLYKRVYSPSIITVFMISMRLKSRSCGL